MKVFAMLISEFACAAGLKTDTVRYYVKRGLLQPQQTTKGGQNPYHIFSQADLEEVLMIRVAKVLGLSLDEIEGLLDARRSGRISKADEIAFIEERRQILVHRAEQMRKLSEYLQLKIDWLKGKPGANPPDISEFLATASREPHDLWHDDGTA
jgi:MerR family transcriptional regulator, copper efflux regulator